MQSLVYLEDFHTHHDQLFCLFGPITDSWSMLLIWIAFLYYLPKQQSRIVLALLLSMTIIAELVNHCYHHYLFNLVDLSKVRNLNWGVPMYSTLIHEMR